MHVSTPSVLTVTELTTRIRSALEKTFPETWVEGEVSNLRKPSSGHLYFTLKDQTSQIRVVLFRGIAQHLRFDVEDGQQVIVRGRLTVYDPRGEYQIILESLEPKGIGVLQIAFEQLYAKFEQEGLFEQERKRQLPLLPKVVGLVTSTSGAAIHDMLTIFQRRCPVIHIVISPVQVQGDRASVQIAEAIRALNEEGRVEVIVVGRGGGSMEDLWCFNEELVVRAIVESKIPVVSAVGHETDFTLADFAADHRSPTPSAAAEAVSPVLGELIEMVMIHHNRLVRAIQGEVRLLRHRVMGARRAIPDPLLWLSRSVQHVDDLDRRLRRALQTLPAMLRHQVLILQSEVNRLSPRSKIQQKLVLMSQWFQRMTKGIQGTLVIKQHHIVSKSEALQNLSPLSILSRGYSILETVHDGHVIRHTQDVNPGDTLRARVASGQIYCVVEKVEPGP
ncbi:MAG: exodeoxyribonuclease VII large subunit [Nitrospirales bacterium]|nr:exodeoxyribonuclease VII large subunit [Nitrospirales bacterium]